MQQRINRLRHFGETHRGAKQYGDDSVVYKIYNWWRTQTDYKVERENLCHFWRVVLIWAPLRWVVQPLKKPAGLLWFVVLALGIAEGLVIWASPEWWSAIPLGVGIVLAILGVIAGFAVYGTTVAGDESLSSVLEELTDEDDKMNIGVIFALLAGPAIFVGYVLFAIIYTVWDLAPVRLLLRRQALNIFVFVDVALVALLLGVVIMSAGLWDFLLIAGAVVLAAIGCIGLLMLGVATKDHIQTRILVRGWRRARQSAAMDSGDAVSVEPRDNILRKLRRGIRTSFRAVFDLLHLIWTAIVAVKVWKACPYVDIPVTEPVEA